MKMAREVFVAGVGMSRFGGPDQPLVHRILGSARDALADADVPYTDVETLYLGSVLTQPMYGVDVVKDLGLKGIPVLRVEGAGAAAAVVMSADALRRLGRRGDVRVAAAQAHSERYDHGHLFAGAIVGPPEMARRAAYAAYEEAWVGPDDVGVIAFHDAYAIEELLYYEEIGLCLPGGGDRLVHDGSCELTGRFPTSTDGGFIGRGHPGGPTGLAQIWELTEQLRGRSGARQVKTPRHGLAHIIGAGSVCYTHILEAA